MTNVGLMPQKSDIWWVFLLQGFAGVILGLMLVTQPGATIVALTTFLGSYWLVTGLLGLVQVFVDRSTPWIWSLLSGLVGILAGLFCPETSAGCRPDGPHRTCHHPRYSGVGHGRAPDHRRI